MTAELPFLAELESLLARCVPGFQRLDSARRLSGGASQETYRLALDTRDGPRQLCLRRCSSGNTGPDRVPGPALAGEAALIQLAAGAGVPEPEILHVLEPGDGLGEGFLMSWLEGETLGQRIARSDAFAALRPGLARRCGELLARIHAIDPATAEQRAGLERFTPEQCVRYWWQRYIALDTPQPMLDYCARWLLDHLPADHRMALVHGDFRNGNLLTAPDGVRAVLDWEMAHIGDPVRDLGWLCTHSWRFGVSDKPVGGFGDYADLLAGYEAASGGRVDPAHLRFWEVFGSFCWAICCMEMAHIYRSGRERNAERAAIGRRSSESQLDCANLILPGVSGRDELVPRQRRDELPALDELIESVRDFLGDEVLPASEGRLGFLTRVARNSLDIALRELQLGEAARAAELARLRALLNVDGTLPQMRAELARRLREGDQSLDQPGLADCLHHTLINRVRIDQPRYAGLRLP